MLGKKYPLYLFYFVFVFSFLLLPACTMSEIQPAPLETELSGDIVQSTPSKGMGETPVGWYQLLPFDGIRPIYQPTFMTADQAPLEADELIMGVAWDGEAKAYPVTILRIREMVNDELAGVPYLVTW